MTMLPGVVGLVATASVLGAQTFTAATFSNWTYAGSWTNAAISHLTQPADGNPAPCYEVTVTHGPPPSGTSNAVAMLVNPNAAWTPSLDGPIGLLQMTIDEVNIAGVAARQVVGVLVRQSGKTFIDTRYLVPLSSQWTTVVPPAAAASDLFEVTGGAVLDGNSHPDFGIGAPTMTFGFAVQSQYSLTAASTSYRYDNWNLTVEALGSFTSVGVGCTPAGPPPLIGSERLPAVGFSNFWVTGIVGWCVPTVAALYVGFSDLWWNGVPLPADMGLLGAPGCLFRIAPDLYVATVVADPLGGLRAGIIIPNDPYFVGLPFFTQWMIVCPGANPLGLIMSPMGAAIIG
jgi:hypothetical protein